MDKPLRLIAGRKTVAFVGLAVLSLLLGTNSALAHAKLLKSNPPDEADLKQAPTRVELWFNELLDDAFNSVEVMPAADLSAKKHPYLAKGQPKVDPADGTHLSIALSALKPGKYVIQYRVLSRDGHIAPGRVTFQIREAAGSP